MDDSTRLAVLEAMRTELATLLDGLIAAPTLGLETAERMVRDGLQALGGHLLETAVAARGTGKTGAWRPCGCGETAQFEGYRRKAVQTLVGWITVRRAYYLCRRCGRGQAPLDLTLGLERDSQSPGVRRLAVAFGGQLPFVPAAALLADAAGIALSASTVRMTTEAAGTQRDAAMMTEMAQAWTTGLPVATTAPPNRLYVAIDGVRILGTDGDGREIKVGVVVPTGAEVEAKRGPASYAAGLESASVFGRRLALEAHRRGAEGAGAIAVLGDGAAWIWNLAAEHFPTATCIVDWFHASERVWALARALHGEGTAETTAWAERHLDRLASGEAATLAQEWQTLPCRKETVAVRDAQITYFTNQAERMQYAAYRSAGWDIGSGMVEGACKHLIGAREKGPGMRWSEAGAHAVAQVRVRLFNGETDPRPRAA